MKEVEVVAVVCKTGTAQVRITRSEWRGRRTVDIRVWFIPSGGGDFVPSRKGLAVDAGKLDELVGALQAASKKT